MWALPGGFMDIGETLDNTAIRELKEETSIDNVIVNRFKIYDTIGRDPRGRTISMIYIGFVKENEVNAKANDDAKEVKWFLINKLPKLAFDHAQIIKDIKKEIVCL